MIKTDPFKILTPNERWAPSQNQMEESKDPYEKLLPPLVYKIRLAVAKWREDVYKGASDTSISLLNFGSTRNILSGRINSHFSFRNAKQLNPLFICMK